MVKWLNKFLLNTQNREELEAISQWRDNLKNDLEAMREQINSKDTLPEIENYESVDHNKAWSVVKRRIDGPVKVDKNFTLRPLFKYAAACALLLASVVAYRLYFSEADPVTYQFVENTRVTLEDNSVISLSPNSRLIEYEKRHNRLEGHAYFDIAPDKSHPFKIDLYQGQVIVVGTEFDIITYPNYSQIYVTEGSVKYIFGDKSYVLNVGDLITVTPDGILNQRKAAIQVKSWQDKKVVFTNESMLNVLYSIAAMHHKQLVFKINNIGEKDKCKINSTYTTETLQQILSELSIILDLKYDITGDKIIIHSFKC
jgi:ferric-dicitrate binding protein FerR (iron transport regulator)